MQRPVHRRLFGVRISAILESICMFVLLLGADVVFGHGDRLAQFSPHPFWIPVLLISAFYGRSEALMVAALSTVALLAWNVPHQQFDEETSAWLLRITAKPLLWFITAAVLGEISSSQRQAREDLMAEIEDLRIQAHAIKDAYHLLSTSRASLEAQLAGQEKTTCAVYAASRAIDQLDTDLVLQGVPEFVHLLFKARKFSLFLLNGNLLEAQQTESWDSKDAFFRSFNCSQPLYDAIVTQRRFLLIVDPDDERVLGAEGILAGPILSWDTGEIFGMLKIEEIDFSRLTPLSVQEFRLACEWIGSALAKAKAAEASIGQSGSAIAGVRPKMGHILDMAEAKRVRHLTPVVTHSSEMQCVRTNE